MTKEYAVINLKKEYPGYTGTEKWMIITDLPETEFAIRYPDEYRSRKNAVFVSIEVGKAIIRFKNNDRKQKWRESVGLVSIDEDEDALYAEDPDAVASITRLWIRDALDTLTDKQSIRVQRYYLHGYSLKEIAQVEGVYIATVQRSIKTGLLKLRKYYEDHLGELEADVDA